MIALSTWLVHHFLCSTNLTRERTGRKTGENQVIIKCNKSDNDEEEAIMMLLENDENGKIK